MKAEKQKQVLSKFLIFVWAAFTAILGHMWPLDRGLDTPTRVKLQLREEWGEECVCCLHFLVMYTAERSMV